YAIARDAAVQELLHEQGTSFHTFKDQVIFEKDEIIKDNGKPYTVFTPYSKKWLSVCNDFYIKCYPVKKYARHLLQQPPQPLPSLAAIGFRDMNGSFPSPVPDESIIQQYEQQRNFPAAAGTSRMGVHLRFGTISIRELV